MTTHDNEYMLTTVDNPFDPFTQFDEWYQFDQQLGYNSSSFLARVARLSPYLSPADETAALHAAIDEIVRENVSGMHTKAFRRTSSTKPGQS